jgi:hemoglobin-like flavoprotein
MSSDAISKMTDAELSQRGNALFNASYDRCMNLNDNDVRFVNHFYAILKGRDQKISDIFEAFPVHHQLHVVRTAIYLLTDYNENKSPSSDFTMFVDSHTDKRLGLEPYMLDIWLDCLLETVAALDTSFSDEIRAAWLARIKPGTDYLKSALEKA